ncbi:hypothetical protein GOBAR_DD21895 [Gossypium barbadense]|nr:hypothetical protein GOBAR_DD21895 [Gossypium barbadense]
METELAKMKAEMRDSAESLMAAKVEADQAEAKLQVLNFQLRLEELNDPKGTIDELVVKPYPQAALEESNLFLVQFSNRKVRNRVAEWLVYEMADRTPVFEV